MRTEDDENEWTRYFRDLCAANKPGFDLLLWWRDNQNHYPILATMARDYLAIPASSTESERAFSSSGLILRDHRNRLSTDTMQALVCLKSWIRLDRKGETLSPAVDLEVDLELLNLPM